MAEARTKKFSIRLTADERDEVHAAARADGITASELARTAVLSRARTGRGLPIWLDRQSARVVRAAAEIDSIAADEWAVARLEAAAAKHIAGAGLGRTVSGSISPKVEEEDDAGE